jgi:nucleotide-binding universal stress UspA family protein
MTGRTGKSRKPGAVLWAVDPFERETLPSLSGVRELLGWITEAKQGLVPVYVAPLPEKSVEAGQMPEVPELEGVLFEYLRRFPLPKGLYARVLIGEWSHLPEMVRTLLEFAREEGVESIVVSSHGRAGMKRLVLGSFAELLLRESPLPVLFLPKRDLPEEAAHHRRVLFPTDFSALAADAFELFLEEASRRNLELLLFHMLSPPAPSMDLGMVPAIPHDFLPEQREWARREGALWMARAGKRGVEGRFLLENEDLLPLSGEAVLAAAQREKARLIAMPSLSSPLTRLVAGSVAHEVFRSGRLPVWLYGPRALAEKRRSAA